MIVGREWLVAAVVMDTDALVGGATVLVVENIIIVVGGGRLHGF